MGALARALMEKIHGCDIYAGFVPIMAPDLQGWNSGHPWLSDPAPTARVILDVGTWKGRSTAFLANAIKQRQQDGCVISIDTFLGSIEHVLPDGPFFTAIPRRHGMPMLYEQFLTNMVTNGLTDIVIPVALPTHIAAEMLRHFRISADLVHIDAAHDYLSVQRDVHAYWDLLHLGGVLIGDDYDAAFPGVVKAADEFAAEMGLTIAVSWPKWRLDKPA